MIHARENTQKHETGEADGTFREKTWKTRVGVRECGVLLMSQRKEVVSAGIQTCQTSVP